METTADTGSPPTPPQGNGGTRRLLRRRHNKVIAGVAGALGDYFGIDPVVFRIVFIVAAFAGGTGVIAYLAAWLLIPEAPESGGPEHGSRRGFERPQTWIGVVLLVIGASMLFGNVGWWSPDVLWALALIGIGVLLFRKDRADRGSHPAAPPPPGGAGPGPAGAPGEGGMVPAASSGATGSTITQPMIHPPPLGATGPMMQAPPRERSSLGWLTLAAALVAAGVAGLLAGAGAVTLAGYQLIALPLTVIGIGLVAGAWLGRARWLILVGALLLPVALVASLVRVPLDAGAGRRFFAPQAQTELRSGYELAAGQMVIDLTDYPFDDFEQEAVDIDAELGLGQLVVVVPPGLSVEARAHASLGQVNVFGRAEEGGGANLVDATGSGAPDVTVDASVSLGEVQVVERTSAAEFQNSRSFDHNGFGARHFQEDAE